MGKRKYSIGATVNGKRGTKKWGFATKKAAEKYLNQLKKQKKKGKYTHIKNPRIVKLK